MDKSKNREVVMISIHPEFGEAILGGIKKIEFRKRNFPLDAKYVVLYLTAPTKLIYGYFKVDNVIKTSPSELWRQYREISGISKDFFLDYYKNTDIGLGILIGETFKLASPITLDQLKEGKRAPQSFLYLDETSWKDLRKIEIVP